MLGYWAEPYGLWLRPFAGKEQGVDEHIQAAREQASNRNTESRLPPPSACCSCSSTLISCSSHSNLSGSYQFAPSTLVHAIQY